MYFKLEGGWPNQSYERASSARIIRVLCSGDSGGKNNKIKIRTSGDIANPPTCSLGLLVAAHVHLVHPLLSVVYGDLCFMLFTCEGKGNTRVDFPFCSFKKGQRGAANPSQTHAYRPTLQAVACLKPSEFHSFCGASHATCTYQTYVCTCWHRRATCRLGRAVF